MARNGRSGSGGEPSGLNAQARQPGERLLALYPGLRTTGWAVIAKCHRQDGIRLDLIASGVAGRRRSGRITQTDRIAGQLQELTQVADRWGPAHVAFSATGGTVWGATGLRTLQEAMLSWAADRGLPCAVHRAAEVRTSLAGKPNASRNALAYAVMQCLGLIGERRTAQEWEAIAGGLHHLQAPGIETNLSRFPC